MRVCKLEIKFYYAWMIRRLAIPHIKSLLSRSPSVALLGPRQSGKTTLARTFSSLAFDLENKEELTSLDVRWPDLLRTVGKPLILDEAQEYPAIFPRIRTAIDKQRKRNGRFLILGSVSQALMKNVSESLAGRVALFELSPFLLGEVSEENRLWLMGGYPGGGILKKSQFPKWQSDYLETLYQRDLPLWGLPAKPQITSRLFAMLAAVHGQIWNGSQIGSGLGLSYHTVNSYLNFLQNAFLIRVLNPYFPNIQKRLIKSPKVYWRDSGLLHALLQVSSYDDLLHQPWVGFSWEGWVIEQVVGFLKTQLIPHEAYFYRTSSGQEVDLVLKVYGTLVACEIKLTTSPDLRDVARLKEIGKEIGAKKFIFISRNQNTTKSSDTLVTNVAGFLDNLKKWIKN